MNLLNKSAHYLDNIFTSLIIILGIILIGINAVQITLRGFFDISFLWVLELSKFLGIWIVLFGASVMFFRDTEVRVTVIVNSLPEIIKKPIDIIINILVIIFGISLIFGNIYYQKYVDTIKPDFLPFSYRVHIFPVYIFSISVIYNGFYNIFKTNNDKNKEQFIE